MAAFSALAAFACGDDTTTTLAQVGTNGAAGNAGASGAVGAGGAASSATGGSSGNAGVVGGFAGGGAAGGTGASAGAAGGAGASSGGAGMPDSPYGPHLNCGIETLDESGSLCAGTCTPTDRCSLPAKGQCATPCTCVNGAWKCGGVVACPSPQVTVGATCTPSELSRWIDGQVWTPFLSDTHVYFTSDRQLMRAAVPCGEPETLAEFDDRVRIAGALAGKLILWTSPEDFCPVTPATQATAWRFDAGTRVLERRDEVHGRPVLFGGSIYTTKGTDIVRYDWGSAAEKVGELAPKHDSLEWVGPTFTVQQQHYFGQPTSERALTVVTNDGFTAGAGSTYDCGEGGPGVTSSGVLYDGVRSFDPTKHKWTQLTGMTSLPFGALDRGGANDCELFGSDLTNGNMATWVPGAPSYTTIALADPGPVAGSALAAVVMAGRYAVVWRRGPTSTSIPLYNGLTGFLR